MPAPVAVVAPELGAVEVAEGVGVGVAGAQFPPIGMSPANAVQAREQVKTTVAIILRMLFMLFSPFKRKMRQIPLFLTISPNHFPRASLCADHIISVVIFAMKLVSTEV